MDGKLDELDKLDCTFDELAKLDCKLDELDKLRMSSMSWISCTVSSMSWLSYYSVYGVNSHTILNRNELSYLKVADLVI